MGARKKLLRNSQLFREKKANDAQVCIFKIIIFFFCQILLKKSVKEGVLAFCPVKTNIEVSCVKHNTEI